MDKKENRVKGNYGFAFVVVIILLLNTLLSWKQFEQCVNTSVMSYMARHILMNNICVNADILQYVNTIIVIRNLHLLIDRYDYHAIIADMSIIDIRYPRLTNQCKYSLASYLFCNVILQSNYVIQCTLEILFTNDS
jgi:hypothetical protein